MALGKRKTFRGKKNIYIGDIHGEGTKLKNLLENLKEKVDLYQYKIIFLGDIVGKGKEHEKLFKTLLELKNDLYEYYIIEGNWDKYLIPNVKNLGKNAPTTPLRYLIEKYERKFLTEYIDLGFNTIGEVHNHWLENKYFTIFDTLIPYFETRYTIATHAPILNNSVNAYYDEDEPRGLLDEMYQLEMIQQEFIRDENEEVFKIPNKLLICGHQPCHPSNNIKNPIGPPREKPTQLKNRIFMDCGGAGTGLDIPIFAYIENLNLFIGSK